VTRWRQASAADRASLAWLAERSSRPHRSPTRLPADEERRICELWSAPAGARAGSPTSRDHPATLEGAPGAAADCVLAPPAAARTPGGGPLPVTVPGPAAAHEHREPGKFSEPGHAVTGDRIRRSRRVGWEYVHSIVDDCSRLGYSEIHDDDTATTVIAFTRRALDGLLDHGVVAERLMTDNAFAYVNNRSLHELLHAREIGHIRTRAPHAAHQRQGPALGAAWMRART
jgi:hypothetical protein